MSFLKNLAEKFADYAYRHAYIDSFLDAQIASQIKVLREQRRLTQSELAAAAGMRQSQISRLEDVNNSAWQVRTLKRIAQALDVALVVRFESFATVLAEVEDFPNRASLERPSFDDDEGVAYLRSDAAAGLGDLPPLGNEDIPATLVERAMIASREDRTFDWPQTHADAA